MLGKKYIFTVLILMMSLFCSTLFAAQGETISDSQDKVFQKLQAELNKEKHKKKVIGRFEKVEGLSGLNLEDISLSLLNYSYHYTNDSGRPQAFITVKCVLNISKFEKEAEKYKKHREAIGRPLRGTVQLPDSERIIVGILDDDKDEFITLGSMDRSLKPVVKFVNLRKKNPEYIIMTAEENKDCIDCDPVMELPTVIYGFDSKDRIYSKVLDIKTYEHVEAYGPDGGIGYIDESKVSWSDWIKNDYRELIVITTRKILRLEGESKAEFKQRKEVYSWLNDKELSLVERIDDGKTRINRKRK